MRGHPGADDPPHELPPWLAHTAEGLSTGRASGAGASFRR